MTDETSESHVDLETPSDAGHVIVPWQRLSPAALRGVLEEFVTREGTEYGEHEVPLERKIEQVQRQLERSEVLLVFDAPSETVNLVRAADLRGAGG